ncbi:MAG: hypothetical protein ACYDEB_08200 [Dehalococcoidia bacterium]
MRTAHYWTNDAWSNKVVVILLKVVTVPLYVVAPFSTLATGILTLIPVVNLAYFLLVNAIWLLCFGALVMTAWFWQHAPPGIRSLAALIGVPLSVLLYTFLCLVTAGGDSDDLDGKKIKQTACWYWPYSDVDHDGVPIFVGSVQPESLIDLSLSILSGADRLTIRR